MMRLKQISTMEGDALKTISAKTETATGKAAYVWEGDKIKLVIKFQIVMLAFTVNSTQTPLFLHANLSLTKDHNAMMNLIVRIRWDAQESI
jgi:hypothetical protein